MIKSSNSHSSEKLAIFFFLPVCNDEVSDSNTTTELFATYLVVFEWQKILYMFQCTKVFALHGLTAVPLLSQNTANSL